jgi:hypothetical protein
MEEGFERGNTFMKMERRQEWDGILLLQTWILCASEKEAA